MSFLKSDWISLSFIYVPSSKSHLYILFQSYRLVAYCIHSFIYICAFGRNKERERERENTSVCLIIILLTVIADHKDMGVENVAVYLPPAIFNDQVKERERTEQSIPGCHRRRIIWLMAIIVVVLTYKKDEKNERMKSRT